MNIQDVGGLRKTVETGIAKVEEMLPLLNEAEREPARHRS
jgi:altronate hydrolase